MQISEKTILIDGEEQPRNLCPSCGSAELQPVAERQNCLRCPVCNFVRKLNSVISPGNIILNKYRILSEFASGAFGDIFLCHPLDDVSERYVLKLLKDNVGNSARRFRREASVLASLKDEERVARIIDFWEEDECMFIIMEYVRGIDLRHAKEKFHFDELAVWQIARETVLALQHIWDMFSIIHRDIKPENIMLDEDFRLKILDFGLCKQCDSGLMTGITMANAVLGTPGYMSPEQFVDSKNVDFRTDVFSLGATLFFLLTGIEPFRGEDLETVYEQTIAHSPPPVSALQDVCSDSGIALIRKMMSKKPEDRCIDYMELLDDIEQQLYFLNNR